jgi:hypothetical protein
MTKDSQRIFLSYAWGGSSEEFANKLDQVFQEKGIVIVRDKRDLGYKGLIKEFMQQMGHGKCVITVISDKYLKSPNCMFELVQVFRYGAFYDRISPIVLADAQIYNPVQRIKYIKHWEDKKKELDEAIKEVGSENLQGIREDIDQYTEVRNTIAKLTDTLKNMNTLTPDIHSQSEFKTLIDMIKRKLVEPTVILQPHEHAFYYAGEELKEMGQKKADEYCRSKYYDLVGEGALPNDAWHVWGHLDAGQCIYNK